MNKRKLLSVSSVLCCIIFAMSMVTQTPLTYAEDLNQIKLRGNAFRVTLDIWHQYLPAVFESRVYLHESAAGFAQTSWFTCPTGSCTNPANLLGCKCRYDRNDPNSDTYSCHPEIQSITPHPAGEVQTWECPDPQYKDGNCLGMTGFVNFEGGELMRPYMTSLGINPPAGCS